MNGDAKTSIGIPYDGYLLEISNDRMIYSKAKIPYVIFDSKCMECNGSIVTCSVKVCLVLMLEKVLQFEKSQKF